MKTKDEGRGLGEELLRRGLKEKAFSNERKRAIRAYLREGTLGGAARSLGRHDETVRKHLLSTFWYYLIDETGRASAAKGAEKSAGPKSRRPQSRPRAIPPTARVRRTKR